MKFPQHISFKALFPCVVIAVFLPIVVTDESLCQLAGGRCIEESECQSGAVNRVLCTNCGDRVCCLPSAERFSGKWQGYLIWKKDLYRYITQITFNENTITGSGNDHWGPSAITGSVNALQNQVEFTKVYSTHSVTYTGQFSDDGRQLTGSWDNGELQDKFALDFIPECDDTGK